MLTFWAENEWQETDGWYVKMYLWKYLAFDIHMYIGSVAYVEEKKTLNIVVFTGGILLNAYFADNDGQITNTEK